MKDAEDLIAKSPIAGDRMLHFLVEIFDRPLVVGVLIQRLFAEMVKDHITAKTGVSLRREGDDLFLDAPESATSGTTHYSSKKLSISIAVPTVRSTLVHFAINCVPTGAPVSICCLEDFHLDPESFAQELLRSLSHEWESIVNATYKVFAD